MPERDGDSKRERESRRTILKKTGYSMTAGGVTLSGLTSVASADPPDNDGPKVGTDVVATSPPGAGDDEWNDFIYEFVSQVGRDIPTYNNPGGLSIKECNTDGNIKACLETSEYVYHGRKDCGGIQTPELYWTSLTAETYYDGTFQVSVEFWVGVNPDTDCLWLGNENAGVCTEVGCDIQSKRHDLDTDPGPFTSIITNMKEWVQDNPDIVARVGAASAVTAAGAAVWAGGGGGGIPFAVLNGMVNSS